MYELIPILSGVIAGAVCAGFDSRAMRFAVIVVIATVAAFVAAFASGEVYASWAFVLWDFAQGAAAAALSLWMALIILTGRSRA